MDNLTDREIYNASNAIDDAFSMMTKENRGKTARIILKSVRDLNDHIADKVWSDLYPNQPMGLQKVASKLTGKYRFISLFDKFLRASVSHFTPSEDGSERLLIKYYKYLLQLKKLVWDKYQISILNNIECFIDDTDEQTKEYYSKVASTILNIGQGQRASDFDNYYVDKIKPFYVNNNIYYEVSLEPATDKPNKFQRITAFTGCDIFDNYSVALSFVDSQINVFNTDYPIKIITDWKVSIRPCEINNFAYLMDMSVNIQRRNNDYRVLMEYITDTHLSLVDIIDLPKEEYSLFKRKLISEMKSSISPIVKILNKVREISLSNSQGKNILRYLLFRLNNKIIKEQRPTAFYPNTYANYNLSSKCVPFDKYPYAHYPKGHITTLYDLYQCIDPEDHKPELLKRYIDNNTYSNNVLFTPMCDLEFFGDEEEIVDLVEEYNNGLYDGFKPDSELEIYKKHVFIHGHEHGISTIIDTLSKLSTEIGNVHDAFSEDNVNALERLDEENRLDDPIKKNILIDMFSYSRVQCIYGAAGTGKTTLVNHISYLLQSSKRVFLAKTHPAVENLRRKVKYQVSTDEFITIDQFIKSSWYESLEIDLIVVDECSTVKNEELLSILNRLGSAVLVLMGDIYQIEAIGFGNWFSIVKNIMPDNACHELTTPYRSTDKYLLRLWDEVRNMSDDNIALEDLVRSDYSHIIDDDIFQKKSDDEIILCLNYNGLYGLNNINKLLQINNHSKSVNIGVWQFKVNDPILFNDSGRFSCLYNNLKGRIINLEDRVDSVYFIVEVDMEIDERDARFEDGLDLIITENKKSQVGFIVNRAKPYLSDNEEMTNYHVIPFQVAYAVSIHKSQGLEYDSVKIVIADETEDKISHNIFYTAITRARKHLTIYWSSEVCNRIIGRIRPINNNKDFLLLQGKKQYQEEVEI